MSKGSLLDSGPYRDTTCVCFEFMLMGKISGFFNTPLHDVTEIGATKYTLFYIKFPIIGQNTDFSLVLSYDLSHIRAFIHICCATFTCVLMTLSNSAAGIGSGTGRQAAATIWKDSCECLNSYVNREFPNETP